jgi:hypothetical protein
MRQKDDDDASQSTHWHNLFAEFKYCINLSIASGNKLCELFFIPMRSCPVLEEENLFHSLEIISQ